MKLSAVQTRRVQDQIGAQAVPEDHAVAPDLQRAFGDHTFFLDSAGLNIVEAASGDGHVGNVVKVARWADADHTTLKVEPLQPTPIEVELGEEDEDIERGV
jgi:hypothetical protein